MPSRPGVEPGMGTNKKARVLLEHPGPLDPLRLACEPAITGACAPHVNASVPQTQEPQGLGRNNNNSRTSPQRSRRLLYLNARAEVKSSLPPTTAPGSIP